MKVIDPGHAYALDKFEDTGHGIGIRFIKKEEQDGELVTIHDGTTNEEVLKMMINRLQYLYKQLPSDETAVATSHLRAALSALNERTKDRKQRGVEGTHKP